MGARRPKALAAVGLVAGVATYACLRSAKSQVPLGTIIDQWETIKAPPPPPLEPVTVSAATTALLLLDLNGAQDARKGPCNASRIPRCIESIAKVAKLLSASRAHDLLSLTALGVKTVPKISQAR